MTLSDAAITVSAADLTVSYRGSPRPQLDGASFEVRAGITALVGRNGAGKSTLIKSLVGLAPLQSGRLQILGSEPRNSSSMRALLQRIGYLPQDFGFVSSFTAREFVEYGAWLKKVPRGEVAARAAAALAAVGLAGHSTKKMGRLSGGMRRRAGIAQSIVHEPELVILDEPTSGLDPEQRIRFREMIREIGRGRTVIISSHLIEDVKALATQVIVLDEGHKVFDGSVDALERVGASGQRGDSALERGYISVIGSKE